MTYVSPSLGSFDNVPLLGGSLFPGDEGEAEMEKLLAMLPAVPAPSSNNTDGTEDTWMSTWLKEEPIPTVY